MSRLLAGADLRERLLALLSGGVDAAVGDDTFDLLARSVFQHQFDRNPVYRRFCEARRTTPASLEHWREIPAVPTDAFKAAPLVCGDPADAEVTFRTSGTTGGPARGVHHLLDTRLYRASLAAGFQRHLLPDGARPRILSLIAPADDVPDSSLSFMISEVARRFGSPGSSFFATASGVRMDALARALGEAEAATEPVLMVGTSFAFVHLLDHLEGASARYRLPAGSRVMDTGGFKGRSREVGRAELYDALAAALGISVPWIVNEYGMTEMSSQFYDGEAGRAGPVEARRYRAPGWVRSFAADPETLRPLPDGETGVLRHFDLANLDSVMALQTADLGAVAGGEVTLRGRARGAEARGCSIAMDELIEAAGRGPER